MVHHEWVLFMMSQNLHIFIIQFDNDFLSIQYFNFIEFKFIYDFYKFYV